MYDTALSLGDVAADRARLAFLQGQLHALALAMSQARARGDNADWASLKSNFDRLYAEAGTLNQRLTASEAPSPVLVGLQRLSEGIQQTATTAAGAAAEGIGLLGRNVLVPLAIVAAVGAALYFLPRRRPAQGAA